MNLHPLTYLSSFSECKFCNNLTRHYTRVCKNHSSYRYHSKNHIIYPLYDKILTDNLIKNIDIINSEFTKYCILPYLSHKFIKLKKKQIISKVKGYIKRMKYLRKNKSKIPFAKLVIYKKIMQLQCDLGFEIMDFLLCNFEFVNQHEIFKKVTINKYYYFLDFIPKLIEYQPIIDRLKNPSG